MPIIRSPHDEQFTQVSNAMLRDTTLSLRAKGLLVLMLSLPDDWTFNQPGIQQFSSDGYDSTASALKELEKAGLLERKRHRGKDGAFHSGEWIVKEMPDKQLQRGKPNLVKPNKGNPTGQSQAPYPSRGVSEPTNKESTNIDNKHSWVKSSKSKEESRATTSSIYANLF